MEALPSYPDSDGPVVPCRRRPPPISQFCSLPVLLTTLVCRVDGDALCPSGGVAILGRLWFSARGGGVLAMAASGPLSLRSVGGTDGGCCFTIEIAIIFFVLYCGAARRRSVRDPCRPPNIP
jgi:hypothetical protein